MTDTRVEILEAARDLIVDKGLHGFSMRKVGRLCGVSATAIYRHFEDKDQLLAEAVLEGYDLFHRYLREASKGRDALERFRILGQQYFAFAEDHPRYYQLMFMTNCADLGLDQLDEDSRQRASVTFSLLVESIEECQREGVARRDDSEAMAVSVWAAQHGLVSLHITGNLGVDGAAFQQLARAQVAILEQGFLEVGSVRRRPASGIDGSARRAPRMPRDEAALETQPAKAGSAPRKPRASTPAARPKRGQAKPVRKKHSAKRQRSRGS